MKIKTAQQFIMTLPEEDYSPFLFFLSSVWLLAEMEEKWNYSPGLIRISICLSSEIDPSALVREWCDWKMYCLGLDYAVLN